MGSRKRTCRRGATRSHLHTFLRRVGCLLTAASLLPVLLLGPLGPGVIVIHDHHEEDLHAHKVHPGSGGQTAAGNGHDHPTDTAVDLEGARFVLTLPDLPRLSTHVQASGLQVKPTLPTAAIASILPQSTVAAVADCEAGDRPVAPLRAHDRIAGLLLAGHSLLI